MLSCIATNLARLPVSFARISETRSHTHGKNDETLPQSHHRLFILTFWTKFLSVSFKWSLVGMLRPKPLKKGKSAPAHTPPLRGNIGYFVLISLHCSRKALHHFFSASILRFGAALSFYASSNTLTYSPITPPIPHPISHPPSRLVPSSLFSLFFFLSPVLEQATSGAVTKCL